MKIEKLDISNFGILADIKLDMTGDQGNLVFINGLNGRGKTTLQSAIRWCFYGDEPTSNTKFVSKFVIKNTNFNEKIKVKVSATVKLDKDGLTAYIERSQEFVKQENGVPKKTGNPVLVIKTKTLDAASLTDIQVNQEAWINQYFPKRLINFFLFDGEMMVNFFNANVKEEIEKAVREIAGVDLFDEISKKLTAVESQINRKISKLTGVKAQKLTEEYEMQQKTLKELYGEYTIEKANLEAKRIRIKEVNILFEEFNSISVIAKRLEDIENLLQSSEHNLKTIERDFYSSLLSLGTISLVSSSFKELKNQVILAKMEDRLPPPFDPERIKILLEEGKCICGCSVDAGSPGSLNLINLIEKYSISSDVGKYLDTTAREIDKLCFSFKKEWDKTKNINSAITNASNGILKLRNEREELTIKLQGSDLASVRALAFEKHQLDNEILSLVESVAKLETQSSYLVDNVNRLDKELEEIAKGNIEAETLKKEGAIARKIAEASSRIHEIAIKQVRVELQKSIQDKFNVVKAGKFKTEINENFEVLTLNEDGTKVDLSEGESMAKAYVFSLALRDVINLGFPLIVDTPFGRLSGDFRAWLSEVLSTFLVEEVKKSDRQIIFLMTDTEYTPYTKNRFSKANGMEFYIQYESGNETDKSNLGVGIDPEWLKLDYWKDWDKLK